MRYTCFADRLMLHNHHALQQVAQLRQCDKCNVLCRSVEIAHIHQTLQQVALPTHIWRRHGLPGRPDGGKASLANMLHKPDTTLEQVRHSSYATYGALVESNVNYGCDSDVILHTWVAQPV